MIFSTLTIPKDGSPGEDCRSMVAVAAAEANSTITGGGGDIHGSWLFMVVLGSVTRTSTSTSKI